MALLATSLSFCLLPGTLQGAGFVQRRCPDQNPVSISVTGRLDALSPRKDWLCTRHQANYLTCPDLRQCTYCLCRSLQRTHCRSCSLWYRRGRGAWGAGERGGERAGWQGKEEKKTRKNGK